MRTLLVDEVITPVLKATACVKHRNGAYETLRFIVRNEWKSSCLLACKSKDNQMRIHLC